MTTSDFQRELKYAADEATDEGGDISLLLDLVKDPQFSWTDKLWSNDEGPCSLMSYVYLYQAWNEAVLVGALLELGADPHEQESDGFPIWYNALPYPAKLKLYLDQGVDANFGYTDSDGNQRALPLMRVAGSEKTPGASLSESAGLLLDCGALVDAQDERGFTALHQAVVCDNFHVAHLLLERGADPSIRCASDETPLDMLRRLHFDHLELAHLEAVMEAGVQQRILGNETPQLAESGLRKRARM